jgi:hypothetical protein
MGKTEFALNYINKCRELIPVEKRDAFQETLCQCRTVRVTLSQDDLLEGSYNDAVREFLCDALKPMFKTSPTILDNPPKSCRTFLKKLTDEVGPIFIVLDEIGTAFDSKSYSIVKQRERFLDFCESVLFHWFELKNVLFLLAGRGKFLSSVGLRPFADPVLTGSPFVFARLHLHLLRPPAITQILQNTYKNGQPLMQNYQLMRDELESLARLLFQKTFGHPRTLLRAFSAFDTKTDLLKKEIELQISDYHFNPAYLMYRNILKDLITAPEKKTPINLTKTQIINGKPIFYSTVAINVMIGWEGSMDNASLFSPAFVIQFLKQSLYSLHDYLSSISVAVARKLEIDYPLIFECMLIKRFDDCFKNITDPKDALPGFFDTPVLGSVQLVPCANPQYHPFPKINKTTSDNPSVDFNSKTASIQDAKLLVNKMLNLDYAWFKPEPKSASSDGLFVSTLADGRKLVLGIAAKNYAKKEMAIHDLEKECRLFNQMVEDLEKGNVVTVLVICATKYNQSLMAKFQNKKSSVYKTKKAPHIHEVVMLNLASKENRMEFFKLKKNNTLVSTVEHVVNHR